MRNIEGWVTIRLRNLEDNNEVNTVLQDLIDQVPLAKLRGYEFGVDLKEYEGEG